jgi:hypothetical protein
MFRFELHRRKMKLVAKINNKIIGEEKIKEVGKII